MTTKPPNKAAKATEPPVPKQIQSSSLPLFYRRPRPLDVRVHGKLSLKRQIGFGFARETNAIPLTLPEFAAAACHYPIVFALEPAPAAFAVVGLRQGENLFVDAKGNWRAAYVPAYARRYPFIFLELNRGEQLALCIDEAGGALEPGLERPLFQDGKQTEAVENALRFCISYQRDYAGTTAFVEALASGNLLTDRQANVALPSGEQIGMTGFKIVDDARFAATSDATFLDWRKRGWLAPVYAHLLSFGCWPRLVELASLER